jgi:hypothetical protein
MGYLIAPATSFLGISAVASSACSGDSGDHCRYACGQATWKEKIMSRWLAVPFVATLSGCAGMQQARESDLTITRVIQAPGYTQAQIYASTKIWIAQNFNSAKAVIELDDKDRGQIIGNGILPYPCSAMDCLAKGDWKVHVTIRVDMKDQRFKITFDNLRISWPASASGPAN